MGAWARLSLENQREEPIACVGRMCPESLSKKKWPVYLYLLGHGKQELRVCSPSRRLMSQKLMKVLLCVPGGSLRSVAQMQKRVVQKVTTKSACRLSIPAHSGY